MTTKTGYPRYVFHGDGGNRQAPLYRVWAGMIRRCYNKNEKAYPFYGGRGITVAQEWRDYRAFKADMQAGYKPGLSIERNNNNGNYERSNCRWATRKEQCRNRRTSHFVEYNGVSATLAEWGERTGIPQLTILGRLRLGWPVTRALTEPVRVQARPHRRTKPAFPLPE